MVVYQYLWRFFIPNLPTHLLHYLALPRRPSGLSLFLDYFLAVVVIVEVVHYFFILFNLMHTLSRFAPLRIQLFALRLALGSYLRDDQHLLLSRSMLSNLLLRFLFLLLKVLPLGISGSLIHFLEVLVLGTLRTTIMNILHGLMPRALFLERYAVLLRMPCIILRRVCVTSACFSLICLRIRISLRNTLNFKMNKIVAQSIALIALRQLTHLRKIDLIMTSKAIEDMFEVFRVARYV